MALLRLGDGGIQAPTFAQRSDLGLSGGCAEPAWH